MESQESSIIFSFAELNKLHGFFIELEKAIHSYALKCYLFFMLFSQQGEECFTETSLKERRKEERRV